MANEFDRSIDHEYKLQDETLAKLERSLKRIRPRPAAFEESWIPSQQRHAPRIAVAPWAYAVSCSVSLIAGVLLGYLLFRSNGNDEKGIIRSKDEALITSSSKPEPSLNQPLVAEHQIPSIRKSKRITAGYLIAHRNIESFLSEWPIEGTIATDSSITMPSHSTGNVANASDFTPSENNNFQLRRKVLP